MGTTQYVDAYQRANFWGTVQSHTGYHVLLGQTVLAEQTLSPPKRAGSTGTVFGFNAGLVDINWFDSQLHTLMTNLNIQPNTFPIFLTYDVYLTQNHFLLHRRLPQLNQKRQRPTVVRTRHLCRSPGVFRAERIGSVA